ncbi:MAG: ABC transporter permease [Planctomycetota bacterium]
MLAYVVRRILLFVPTILGATFLVFTLMYFSPSSIEDTMLPPDGQMTPGARAETEAYLNARFGLDDPFIVQYLRWLNNVSPIGVPTIKFDDPEAVESRNQRRQWRAAVEQTLQADDPELRAQALIDAVDEREDAARAAGDIDFGKEAGDPVWGNPFKGSDLGFSFIFQRRSSDLIAERLPITLLLNALSIPLALSISILTGVWAAKNRGGWQDVGSGTTLLALYSIPVIWTGVLAIGFLANDKYLPLFPAGELSSLEVEQQPFFPSGIGTENFRRGFLLDSLWHLVLPVFCLTYAQFAYLSKLSRTSMLETLNADFVRTARAKGLPGRVVIWRHAFRNALGPIITFLAALLPAVIAGSIVVETIFTIDGMGLLLINALKLQDRELFLSLTLVTLLLTIASYLVADIAYAIADPRVSYD